MGFGDARLGHQCLRIELTDFCTIRVLIGEALLVEYFLKHGCGESELLFWSLQDSLEETTKIRLSLAMGTGAILLHT
jgi:hypothetical protein